MESVDDVLEEYIGFINKQDGAYMDALAGFKGHCINTELQIQRNISPQKPSVNSKEQQAMVWVSYEDPMQPTIIHNSIVPANDYIAINSQGGSNEQQYASAILVFIYTYWENEIRLRLANAKNVGKNEIKSDIMGDLRIIRIAILHTKNIIRKDEYKRLKKLKKMFVEEKPMNISVAVMYEIFKFIKQDIAMMLNIPIKAENIDDIAIQKFKRF